MTRSDLNGRMPADERETRSRRRRNRHPIPVEAVATNLAMARQDGQVQPLGGTGGYTCDQKAALRGVLGDCIVAVFKLRHTSATRALLTGSQTGAAPSARRRTIRIDYAFHTPPWAEKYPWRNSVLRPKFENRKLENFESLDSSSR